MDCPAPAEEGLAESNPLRMKPTPLAPNPRFDLIDALRGSALLGILLLHSI